MTVFCWTFSFSSDIYRTRFEQDFIISTTYLQMYIELIQIDMSGHLKSCRTFCSIEKTKGVPIFISASAISAYRHFFFNIGILASGKHLWCRYCRYLNIGIWRHIGKISARILPGLWNKDGDKQAISTFSHFYQAPI